MKRVIDFLRLRWVFIAFSAVLITGGAVGYVVNGGFNLSVDFTSGLTQQFQINPAATKAAIADVRAALSPINRFDLQAVGNPQDQEFAVKVMAPKADSEFQMRMESQILDLLSAAFGLGNITVQASDFVGPRYSQELASQTISIILVALVLILIYAAFRFHFIYGMAAVLCLVHDALFMLAVVAVFRLEFTTTTVAAVLTIIGYSINDTIVIFDRVRENRSLMRDADLATILNTSISQTLGRTMLTSITVFLSIITLYVVGSGDIKNFALIMLVGIVEGTYSTIFIASPIVLEWTQGLEKQHKRRDLQKYGRPLAAVPAHERREAPAAAETAVEEPQPTVIPGFGAQVIEDLVPESPGPEAPGPLSLEPAGAAQPAQTGVSGPDVQASREVESPSGPGGYIRVQPQRKKKKHRH